MPHRDRWLLLGWCLLLAILVRWPTSVFWDNLPQDPNTPLHALAALDLASGTATPFELSLLGYPDGLPVRLLAWPVLLASAPFQLVVDPLRAFNLGVLLWLTLQGLMVGLLGERLGWKLHARGVAAAAMITAPTTLRALGNGQYENLVAVAYVLGVLALLSRGRSAAMLGIGAGLIAAFSSPYQGVVLGVLLGLGVLMHRPKETWPALAGGLGALCLAVIYYVGVTSGDVHLSAVPAPGVQSESASLGEVFLPTFYAPPHIDGNLPTAGLAGVSETLRDLFSMPKRIEFGRSWPWVESVPYGYAGFLLVVLGFVGLWKHRAQAVSKILLGAGVVCLLMAMGSRLVLAPGVATGIPMPWAIPSMVESVGQMQATVRFLTGLAFASVIGLGFLCSRLSPRVSIALGTLVALDGLLLTPAHWPVPAAAPDIQQIADTLGEGPVASWPGPPKVAPRHHQALALLLDRPVAWFSGPTEAEDLPEKQDRHSQDLNENELGETPNQWLRRVGDAGVSVLLQFREPYDEKEKKKTKKTPENLGAVFQRRSAPVCSTEVCAWEINEPPPVAEEEDGSTPADPH